MLNFISAFLLIYSLQFQDPSGFWIKSAESSSDTYFFKSKYLSKVGTKITIWVKQVHKVSEEKDGKNIAYELMLEECNCSDFSTRLLSDIEYTENGDVIKTYNFKDGDKSYAPPGSVAFKYVSDICTRFNKKKK